jgi:hypothetical protein
LAKPRRSAGQIATDQRAVDLRTAFESALLIDLKSDDPTSRRAACKLFSDDVTQKYSLVLEENEALKQATALAAETSVPRADLEAAVAARLAAESEAQSLKDSIDSALADERRTLRHGLASIEQREHDLKIKIEAATKKFESAGIKAVIEILQKMVQSGDRTIPDFFKCPCKHVLLWKTFWEDTKAETWCRLAREDTFSTDSAVEVLHVPDCPYDGWEAGRTKQLEKSTPESRAYAKEFLKHKGWTDEQIRYSINALVKDHSDRDLARPRPNVYDLMERSQRLHPTPLDRVRPSDSIAAKVERPPTFVPDVYPYCDGSQRPDCI